ncbi:lipopolysaccharide assembly protein LapB [Alcanivorax sp. DP30]|uniref:tetratricopeptide repeat protein n=2 Tax=unclassified Alcanivorax TaxID=2638842 RepID=UPI0019276966|nr:tetratricopeptide repeat protein [Alcanivorax sp. DP30]
MDAKRLPIKSLITALLVTISYSHASTCEDGTQTSVMLPNADRNLVSLLDQPATDRQAPMLLEYNSQAQSINKPILGNYARLRLAALALQDGDTHFARQQLSQIEQNSPAAVDAALLLAESYRKDGDRERARAWFLRIAARFPGNPRAVSGLVLAGDDWRKQGAVEQALPVYNLALTKASENMKALEELENNPDRLYRALTNSVAGNSTTVMDQLVLALVRDSDSRVLDSTRQLIAAKNQMRCLQAAQKTLDNAIEHASARDLSNGAFRQAAKMEKKATEQEIADLERILVNAPKMVELQQRLDDAQGRLTRLEQRLDSLGSTALPPELEQRKQQMDANKAALNQAILVARDQVRSALEEELPVLKRFYRNLAGEAQLGIAQLLQNSEGRAQSSLVGYN